MIKLLVKLLARAILRSASLQEIVDEARPLRQQLEVLTGEASVAGQMREIALREVDLVALRREVEALRQRELHLSLSTRGGKAARIEA